MDTVYCYDYNLEQPFDTAELLANTSNYCDMSLNRHKCYLKDLSEAFSMQTN